MKSCLRNIPLYTLIFILSLLILSPSIYSDVTSRDIEKGLLKDLRHPYVYFSVEERDALKERVKTDPLCSDFMQRLTAEANRLLYTPVSAAAPERSKNPRFEASYVFEQYLTDNTNLAYTLALVYQMTGEKKYAEKAFEFIDAVCDQPTWVHGAHEFPVIYDRVWPWGARDDQVVFSYAQWTDHLVFDIAAVYDWLYPALEKRQRDRIRGALLEKAILRVRGNYDYHWWAAAYRCNWCAVLNSSLGIASIALLSEDPQLTDVIAESYNRIGRVLDQVGDGGWAEGVSYMSYMLDESLRFADVLKRATGGQCNLYRHPRLNDAVKTLLYCQIPPGHSVHFGDSGGGGVGNYSLLNQLMAETGNRQAAWLMKNLGLERPASLLGCIRPKSTLEPALPPETSIRFRSVDWVIMRSDFIDPDKVVIAAKCGPNNDPHHGHLDAGHFTLSWNGQEFICDHGSAGYDKAYFDKDRWDYPLAASIGHNVVLVNGEQQFCSKLKDQPWNESIGGRIVEFRPGKNRDYALLDPTGAYPGKELKSWRRHIILEKPLITVVVDEVASAPGAEIEARFHSSAQQTVKGKYVSLKSGGSEMALIPVLEGDFTLRPGKHAIMMAQRNASFRWVPYFGTVTRAGSERTVLATIIVPVSGDGESEQVIKSTKRTFDPAGNLVLTFEKGGRKYEYRFRKGAEGLVME
ncbi:MAG: heparinase II/III family protein [Candidatus Latescibacter sp.]|nr:heparinase II/III family protein [Candidatus Latescibacter sp.]